MKPGEEIARQAEAKFREAFKLLGERLSNSDPAVFAQLWPEAARAWHEVTVSWAAALAGERERAERLERALRDAVTLFGPAVRTSIGKAWATDARAALAAPGDAPQDRYWILLYDPGLDRQIRVLRDAPSLEAAREAAVTDTGLEVIAAGLYRRGEATPSGGTAPRG